MTRPPPDCPCPRSGDAPVPGRLPHSHTAHALTPPARERGHSCPRSAFTVIELLVVIGVLAVLFAISLPTIRTVHTATLKKRAQAEASLLAQAAVRYKAEYGFWPGQLRPKGEDATSDAVELREPFKNPSAMISVIVSGPESFTSKLAFSAGANPVTLNENEVYQALCRVGRRSGETAPANPLNPKGIHFLDLVDEEDPERVSFRDPWNRDYVLFMGLNPKSTFTHTVTFPDGGRQDVRVDNAVAFAFSYGPDGERSTNYLYSAGVRP